MTRRRVLLAVVTVSTVIGLACGSSTTTSPSTATTSPVTETWTGLIGPNGSAARSFTISRSGTVTLTVTSSDVPIGIGIGVPRVANGGCRLTISQTDAAGGVSLSTPADTGTYCVELFDQGKVVKQAAFSLQIVYP